MSPTETGRAPDAVTSYASAGSRPDTALGHRALADAAVSYRSAFAITMLLTAAVVLVVGLVGTVLIARHEKQPAL